MIDQYGALMEQSAKENWTAQRETYASATLSNRNITWTSLELNPGSPQEEALALQLGQVLSEFLHFACETFQMMS
jgi:hypothetical protein